MAMVAWDTDESPMTSHMPLGSGRSAANIHQAPKRAHQLCEPVSRAGRERGVQISPTPPPSATYTNRENAVEFDARTRSGPYRPPVKAAPPNRRLHGAARLSDRAEPDATQLRPPRATWSRRTPHDTQPGVSHSLDGMDLPPGPDRDCHRDGDRVQHAR
jgi:hypothetical protein